MDLGLNASTAALQRSSGSTVAPGVLGALLAPRAGAVVAASLLAAYGEPLLGVIRPLFPVFPWAGAAVAASLLVAYGGLLLRALAFLAAWAGVAAAAWAVVNYGELLLNLSAIAAFSGYAAFFFLDRLRRPGFGALRGGVAVVLACLVMLFPHIRSVARKIERSRAAAAAAEHDGGGEGGRRRGRREGKKRGQGDKPRTTTMQFNMNIGPFCRLKYKYVTGDPKSTTEPHDESE